MHLVAAPEEAVAWIRWCTRMVEVWLTEGAAPLGNEKRNQYNWAELVYCVSQSLPSITLFKAVYSFHKHLDAFCCCYPALDDYTGECLVANGSFWGMNKLLTIVPLAILSVHTVSVYRRANKSEL
jgi:hypothetical protein